jgi:hypothetical protein
MEWLAGVLALLLLLFIALYRKSLKESRDLTNFALLILLDEGVCANQRKALTQFVRSSDARDAADLRIKVSLATAQLAARLGHTLLGTAGLLWKLRRILPLCRGTSATLAPFVKNLFSSRSGHPSGSIERPALNDERSINPAFPGHSRFPA